MVQVQLRFPSAPGRISTGSVQYAVIGPEQKVTITPDPTQATLEYRQARVIGHLAYFQQVETSHLEIINNTGSEIEIHVSATNPLRIAAGARAFRNPETTSQHSIDLLTGDIQVLRLLKNGDDERLNEVLQYREAIEASLGMIKALKDCIVMLESELRQQSPAVLPAIVHRLENDICNKRKEIAREQAKILKTRFELVKTIACPTAAASQP